VFVYICIGQYLIDVLVATESGNFEIAWSSVMLCCNTISRSKRILWLFVWNLVENCPRDNPQHNSFLLSFSFYSTLRTILISPNLSLKNLELPLYTIATTSVFWNFPIHYSSDSRVPRVNKTLFYNKYILIINSFRQFVCYIICRFVDRWVKNLFIKRTCRCVKQNSRQSRDTTIS
jgi:hypothetical protein